MGKIIYNGQLEKKIMTLNKICVYCGSSDQAEATHLEAATRLGRLIAEEGIGIVYGGGSAGSMGKLANGALERGGTVTGYIPGFMVDQEWAHRGITELHIVEDMHQRKDKMIEGTDAVVALPGGCGTFEELFETISLKRLGLYFGPIVLLNMGGFFDSFIELFDRCIADRFMAPRHRDTWLAVTKPEEVVPAIRNAAPWPRDARTFAALR